MPRPVQTSSLTRRTLHRLGTLTTTALTGALAAGLVISGAGFLADRAESVELPRTAPPVAVQAAPLHILSGYEVSRAFIGQIEPLQQTDLAFEAGGTLADILVEEGAAVTRGQILARLDTRGLEAQRDALVSARDALQARLSLARLTAERQQKLEEKGFAATQRYDEARFNVAELTARIAETEASLAGIDIQLDKAVLRAPFDGKTGRRAADTGQTVASGTPVLTLLQSGAPQMRVGLPPQIAAGLTAGMQVTATFGDRTYDAELTQLRPDLDPATRTRSAIFTLRPDPGAAPPPFGQSGSITLTQTVADAGAWVPLLSLREGARGSWTVLTVDPADPQLRVAPEAVELLYADATRAFVRGGFPDGAMLVTNGPHRIAPGQSIRLTETD
ncbi:MAG: efflux RND transporter periplasmic adaptor subunit [Rhodobacter sp.]|nr:efflux RND transporter periplasmic adaptor subunit [Rhodobacter sp.]